MEQVGVLGSCDNARRAATGTELIEWVMTNLTMTWSLVIRKLSGTRVGELAIHRFLSAPSVTDKKNAGNLGGANPHGDQGPADCRRGGHHRDQFFRPTGQSSRARTAY